MTDVRCCPVCGCCVTRRGRRGPLSTYCTVQCRDRAERARRSERRRRAARMRGPLDESTIVAMLLCSQLATRERSERLRALQVAALR